MLTKSTCKKCHTVIEIDHAEMNREVDCPVCGQKTFIGGWMQNATPGAYSKSKASEPKSNVGTWLIIGGILVVLGFVNFWVAATIAVVCMLAAILMKMGNK